MNKNTIIGTLLISVLIMFYVSNSAKTAEKQAEQKVETEVKTKEIVQAKKVEETIIEEYANLEVSDTGAVSEIEVKAKAEFGEFYRNIKGKEEITTLENNLVKIEISNKGAQIKKVELKEFTTWDKQALNLIDNTQKLNLQLATKSKPEGLALEKLFFEVQKIDANSVSLKLKLGENQYFEQIYSLSDNSYFVDFDINLVNLQNVLLNSKSNLKAQWDYEVRKQEKGITLERSKANIYFRTSEGEIDYLKTGGRSDEIDFQNLEFIAFKDQFFNATILSKNTFKEGKLKSTFDAKDTTHIALYNANIVLEQDDASKYEMQYFFGPNDYKLLKTYDKGLEDIVELSSPFFLFKWVSHITKWVIIPIFRFLDGFNLNYGIIIILLTLIIRMAMMPLTFKSYVSTAKTKLLKPELDKLKEKYKDDQQKFAAEQMKLYKSTEVSMFGGCLPMLLQMPFFLAMFYFFPSSIELRQQSFLWATDLSTYDVLFNLPFTIPIFGSHVSGFTLLMTISSLVMARFNPQMQNNNLQPGMEMMKYMPYIFPFFLLVIFNQFSSALTLYYFVSNMVTLGQQLFINKFMIDEDKLMKQIEENKKKPKKTGGFAAKLEEMAKKQQEEKKNKEK